MWQNAALTNTWATVVLCSSTTDFCALVQVIEVHVFVSHWISSWISWMVLGSSLSQCESHLFLLRSSAAISMKWIVIDGSFIFINMVPASKVPTVFVGGFAAPVSGACTLWTSAGRDTQSTRHAGLLGISLQTYAWFCDHMQIKDLPGELQTSQWTPAAFFSPLPVSPLLNTRVRSGLWSFLNSPLKTSKEQLVEGIRAFPILWHDRQPF